MLQMLDPIEKMAKIERRNETHRKHTRGQYKVLCLYPENQLQSTELLRMTMITLLIAIIF